MRHFPVFMKSALVAACALSVSMAAAQYQRVPSPGYVADPAVSGAKFAEKNLSSFPEAGLLEADAPEALPEGALGKKVRQRPANPLRSADTPKGNINVLCSRFMGQAGYEQSYYGKLDPITGRTTPIYRGSHFGNGDDFSIMTGVVRNNILYIPELHYSQDDMIMGTVHIRWKRIDLNNGNQLEPLMYELAGDGGRMLLYSATYVESEDKIYGLSWDVPTETGGTLVSIDCSQEVWTPTVLGQLGSSSLDYMVNIVYNPVDEKLYGFVSNGTFNEIGFDNQGKPVAISVAQYDDWDEYYCYLPAYYSGGICYSPYDHAFIYHLNNPSTGEYYTGAIDAETFQAYLLSEPEPLAYYPMLYCTDSYADENAPDRMAKPQVSFSNADLSGSYSFTAPTVLFNGVKIEGNVTVHVLVDGTEVYQASVAPGASVNQNLTVSQGMHDLDIYASVGNLNGPKARTSFYAGYDVPAAPTGLAYTSGILTWNTPSNKGVNSLYGGYIDLSDVTYDVYINDTKVNNEPISGNQYALDAAQVANGRCDITVTATSHGLTSAKSAAISRTLGQGYTLPVTFVPTPVQADQFEVVDVNNDGYKFNYWPEQYGDPVFSLFTTEWTSVPNDWLFLPPVYCDSAEALYEFTFDFYNAMQKTDYYDTMDICIGTDPKPSAMGEPFYSHDSHEQITQTKLTSRFSVPKPGTYYIGIHSKASVNPETPNHHRGIYCRNFVVEKSNSTVKAPGALENVVITSSPDGDLFFEIEANLPTKAIDGTALDANSELTLEATSDMSTSSTKGKPGEKIHLSVPTSTNGINTITFYVHNAAGNGLISTATIFVGIDAPLPPQNVQGKISDDNMSVVLTWDKVGAVGQHGGFVDPEDVTYDIFTQSSITTTKVGNAGKELSYTYTTPTRPQARINIGPVATNFGGSSVNGTFFSDILGAPYETPMVEEWGATAFNYTPWTFNNVGSFANCTWEHCTDPASFDLGNPMLVNEGGIIAYSAGGTATGELRSPKVTTKDVNKVQVSVRYWDFEKAGKMEFWGRTAANQEYRKVGELEPSRQGTQWAEFVCDLPADFANQGWIQVNLRAIVEPGQYVLIDNYKCLQNIENDFQLSTLEPPHSVFVGDNAKFNIVVTNSGNEINTGNLLIELLGDDEVVYSETVAIGRTRPSEVFEYQAEIPMLENYVNFSFFELRATATCPDDENDKNDSKIVEVNLYDHSMPIVRDLKADRAENSEEVNLSWSKPDASYKNIESFELAPAFQISDTIDRFINIDGDGKTPFTIEGKRWTDDNKPCGWQVYDARAMNSLDDERLSALTGDRMLIARSIAYADTEEPTRSFDWLISPEVVGGTSVSFMMNILSTTYTETIQLWVSTTDNTIDLSNIVCDANGNPRECGSFKHVQNFTKSGSESWEVCAAMLASDVKYFALVYASYGQFAAMVDDLRFTPAEKSEVAIDGYDIYVAENAGDEPQIIGTVNVPGFVHTPAAGTAPTYYVKTIHNAGGEYIYSPLSNPASVGASGVGELEAGQYIGGGKGQILIGGAEGVKFTLYDLEGRVLRSVVLDSDHVVIPCAAGIYTARLGENAVKIVVR